jgi:hypothetical protein
MHDSTTTTIAHVSMFANATTRRNNCHYPAASSSGNVSAATAAPAGAVMGHDVLLQLVSSPCRKICSSASVVIGSYKKDAGASTTTVVP